MKLLGLDYGSKTVGIAATDNLGITVQPLKTLFRERESSLRKTLSQIKEIIDERGSEAVVIGLPLNMDGTEGERAEKAREFGRKLSLRINIPVYFEDERLTTCEAEEILDLSGINRKDQKMYIDQIAAELILRQYLDKK